MTEDYSLNIDKSHLSSFLRGEYVWFSYKYVFIVLQRSEHVNQLAPARPIRKLLCKRCKRQHLSQRSQAGLLAAQLNEFTT